MGTIELIDYREKVPRQIYRGTITNKKAVQDILKFIKGKYWILVIIKTHKCYQNNEQYEDTAQ